MSATAAQIAQVRRWINESTTTTYDDDAIASYIEAYPLVDEQGEDPYDWDNSTQPPTKDDNEDWYPTYDLHAATADIWEEKAAIVAQDYTFSADGGNYSRSLVFEQYMKLARFHGARCKPTTHRIHKYPAEKSGIQTLLTEFGS